MSRIGLLLHLHQSPIQEESTLREIVEQCYLPLVKFIKNKRKFNLTLSISLSLLEQLDQMNYTALIKDIKELVEGGKITLAGTAAYSPLLTRLPQDFVERQIILNEYAQGYYFGKKGGFEGDSSIMLQNVNGFFPPELALSEGLLNTVSELGYEWVVADESSVEEGFGLYNFKDLGTKLVVRNSEISNLISDKKDSTTSDILESLNKINKEIVVALRAEVLGHENKRGIELLEDLTSVLAGKETYFVSINEYINRANENVVTKIIESNWSTADLEAQKGEIYSRWESKANKNQKIMWKLLNKLTELYKFDVNQAVETGSEELAIWVNEDLNKIGDEDLVKQLELELTLSKVMCSEQFLLDSNGAQPYIDMYLKLAKEIGNGKFLKLVKDSVK